MHLFAGKGVLGVEEYLSFIAQLKAFLQSRLLADGIRCY